MRDIRKQLKIIAERASEYLRRWGIDKPIVVGKRRKKVTYKETSFWGWGSWERPAYVFKFGDREVGAYSDKVKVIRVKPNIYICGRPYSLRCKDTQSNIDLLFSVDFLLAVGALCLHLLENEHVLFARLEAEEDTGRVWLTIANPLVRVILQPDKAILRFEGRLYEFQQEGSIDDTLARLIKIYALLGL